MTELAAVAVVAVLLLGVGIGVYMKRVTLVVEWERGLGLFLRC